MWEGGELVRSLSLSPDAGIVEDIGARLPFELPFWAGEHPVTPIPGWDAGRAYPLDFHPLELGAEALRNLCGFVLEGRPAPGDIEPFDVHLHGFHVTDPTGAEAAAREAAVRAALRARKPARRFRYAPDGSLVEVDAR